MRTYIDQKRFEVTEKGNHWLERRRKMHTKNKKKTKKCYIWQIMRSKTLT